jgi:NADH dehydrogenase [ubiquinone] 1 alpha subcomplex assembly factor 5
LHWSNYPKKDLSNQINFLKPGGIFMGCLFGADTLKELRDSFFKAEVQITGKTRPRISPLPEIRDIGNLAQNVGMKRVVADKESLTLEYETVIELLKSLREMGETNSVLDRNKAFSRRDVFDLMEKYYNKNHPFNKSDKNNNGIRATFEIIYLYGEK